MTVHLEGKNFEITKLCNEAQPVTDNEITDWAWDVTPLQSGDQKLSLLVTIRLMIPGSKEETKDLPVLDRRISVKVDPIYSITTIISNYWQWIAVTMIIPGAGWIYKRRTCKRRTCKRSEK